MINEFAQSLRALFVIIDGGIHKFLKIFEAGFSFVSVLNLERTVIAAIEDCGLHNL